MSAYSAEQRQALEFIHEYNDCFYRRDVSALKQLYCSEAFTVFWDNHRGSDSAQLDDHFVQVSDFFENGKQTETGSIEPLLVEQTRCTFVDAFAVVTAVLRYHSHPKPSVRSTFVLVHREGRWKACHIHHSFDPNEQSAAD